MSEPMKCPQCAKTMQSDAKVCGFCSYDLVNKQPAKPAKNALLGCFSIVALIIVGVLILGGIRSIVNDRPATQAVPTQ